MKTFFFFFAIGMLSLSTLKTCSAQPPDWVVGLSNSVFPFDIDQITHWEEKQKTWYHINDALDNSDSVSVNTLIVKGTTTSGGFFIGAIPVANQVVNSLGTTGINSESCEAQCGCQQCKFKYEDYGCQDCGDCVKQEGCECWCKHTLTRDSG